MLYRVNCLPQSYKSLLPIAGGLAVVLLILGIVTPQAATAETPKPKPASSKPAPKADTPSLPPDLDRIPRDAAAFVSIRIADTVKKPFAARIPKRIEELKRKGFQGALDVTAVDLERFVVVIQEAQPEVRGVMMATANKPLDRERFLSFFTPEKREKKVGKIRYYAGGKPMSFAGVNPPSVGVCFLNDRTVIFGLEDHLQHFLKRPIHKDKDGPVSEALALAGRHTLVAAAGPELFAAVPRNRVPKEYRNFLPLLEACGALLTLDLDETMRARFRLTFPDEEKAKRAEPAAKSGLQIVGLHIKLASIEWEEKHSPRLDPHMPKLLKLIDVVFEGVLEREPRRQGVALEHTARIHAPGWLNVLLEAMAALPANAEDAPPPVAPKPPDEVEAVIKKRGGYCRRDKKQAGAPIVEVSFSRKKLTEDDFALLSSLTALKKLSLLECGIADDGMKRLAKLVNLEELDLEGNSFTDAGLEQLKGMTKLRRFTASGNGITDAGLVHLKGLKALAILRLMKSTKITDKGMTHLAALENLEELDLSSNALTGAGLVHLQKLTELKLLALRFNRIRDTELVHLKEIKNLDEVQLTGNFGLTDASVPALKELKNLKKLSILFTEISDKGIADLKKALPKTDVARD